MMKWNELSFGAKRGYFFESVLLARDGPSLEKTKEGLVSFNPQRVLKQLWYDQGTIMNTGKVGNSNALIAEARFIGDCGD